MIGYIYAIVNSATGQQYIGSTFMTINERYLWHQSSLNKCSSKAIISEHASVKLLEEVVVETKADLRLLERKWFSTSENVVNKNRPYRTEDEKKQQLVDYRGSHAAYFKTYRDQAAGKWGEHFTCDCGGRYTLINKNAHLKREKHCDFITTQTKLVN